MDLWLKESTFQKKLDCLFNNAVDNLLHDLHQGDQRPRDTVTVPSQVQDPIKAYFDRRDAVIPNLHTLRSNATVSDAVNNLLASYEGRIQADIQQGKQQSTKRSGRYNTHDTISAQPHLRWPNEGFHASNGKKMTHIRRVISSPVGSWPTYQYPCDV